MDAISASDQDSVRVVNMILVRCGIGEPGGDILQAFQYAGTDSAVEKLVVYKINASSEVLFLELLIPCTHFHLLQPGVHRNQGEVERPRILRNEPLGDRLVTQ